jgi:CubicO group peptidase (beta-lactamase class C family)
MRANPKHVIKAILLAVYCSGVTTMAQDASSKITSDGLARLLEPVFTNGMKKENIPGAVFVLVKDGQIVMAKGYGVADVAAKRGINPDKTIFPIASITKVFTATALMQLVDRGRLDLHANVNRYLTSLQVPDTYPQAITAAHLLTHTSGLDELPGRRVKAASEVVPLHEFLASRLVRVHPPGEMTSYSSYGIALAGLLVTEVSGEPFESYLSAHIWKPLGMTRTWITVPPSEQANLATAYEIDGGKPVSVPYEIYQTPPTASVVSTASDMAKFMIAHLQKGRFKEARILSEGAAETMQQQHATMHPRMPGWAYGWQLTNTNGRRIIAHGGDIGGFSAQMALLPDEGVGFLVVHHLEGTNLRFTVERAILDHYFPDRRSLEVPKPPKKTSDNLGRFAGKYRANNFCHSCPGGGPNVQDFEVKTNDDGTISVWDQKWFPLEPLYFVSEDGRRHIGFKEDKDGQVLALTAGAWKVLERIR